MMQRTIKFKAKRLDNKEWAYGSLVKTPFGIFIEWYEDSICNKVEVDPSTVCQYTGLKDKDGKEVWEHDIVKSRLDSLYEVVWNNDLAIFTLRSSSYISETPLGSLNDSIFLSVVGNKFDKKEGK